MCDAGNCRLQLFDGPSPSFLRAVGGSGAAPGRFTEPRGVALVGAQGGLLLVVAESRRMQVLTLLGEPLQLLAPGPPQPAPLRAGPPGLWGVAVGRDDARGCVVNANSNELHLLTVRAPRLPDAWRRVSWSRTREGGEE